MIRLLLIMILLGASAALGLFVKQTPGTVLLTTQHWSIEAPLWMAILLTITFCFLLHFLCLLFHASCKIPAALRQWSQRRQDLRAIAMGESAITFIQAEAIEDWCAVSAVLPELNKQCVLPSQSYTLLHRRCTLAHFRKQSAQASSTNFLTICFNRLPKTYQYEPDFLLPYCHFLHKHQQWQLANQLIMQALKTSFHESLILLYAELPLEENKPNLIKKLLKRYPQSAALHYCLGRFSLTTQLFGRAKTHFEQALQIQPQPFIYYYLAKTLEHLEQVQKAGSIYQQGLKMLVDCEPNPSPQSILS